MRAHFGELSRVQQVISMCLVNNISDKKVYDRLNKVGVCLSYNQSMEITNNVGSHFIDLLAEAVKENKYIRFIGDNLNFVVDVHDERQDHHKHMVHMFASSALAYEMFFTDKPNVPEIPIEQLRVEDVLPSRESYRKVRPDFIKIAADNIPKYIPQLAFVADVVPKTFASPDSEQFAKKTTVIPLPVLDLNEQHYAHVVQIFLQYQNWRREMRQKAGVPPDDNTRLHIGGDQLTRERFSHALHLRLRNPYNDERIDQLGPVTFEFLHLMMNILTKMIYHRLYKDSDMEQGTMKHAKERIHRHSVDPNDLKKYDQNRDLFISFFRMNLIEAATEFFGMEDRHGMPTKHIPPAFENDEEKKTWVYETLGRFIDEMVFPKFSGKQDMTEKQGERDIREVAYELKLSNGMKAQILRKQHEESHAAPEPDYKKQHGHLVLELGTMFTYMCELIKCPNRERIICAVKMLLPMMKTNNPGAKYPLELLRFMVQQLSLLPIDEASRVLHACFVNTRGQINTHVPADQQMEWIVKANKKHIKHMYGNKNEKTIKKKSSAIPGVQEIANNFDDHSNVIIRSKKHSERSAEQDELTILEELHQVRPFRHVSGRAYTSFPNINSSMLDSFDGNKFRAWFYEKKDTFVA